MILKLEQLINLPVYTKNGDLLGKIKGFEVNSATHSIDKYEVGGSQMIKRMTVKKLIINQSQVVSLDNEKMVVDDNVQGFPGLARETAIS